MLFDANAAVERRETAMKIAEKVSQAERAIRQFKIPAGMSSVISPPRPVLAILLRFVLTSRRAMSAALLAERRGKQPVPHGLALLDGLATKPFRRPRSLLQQASQGRCSVSNT